MREVSVVLDLLPSGKHRSGFSPPDAGDRICRLFGGYTAQVTFGCWHKGGGRGDDFVYDPSITYTCGIHYSDWPEFKTLAKILASGQETVYVRGPWGEVEILPVGVLLEATATPVPDEAMCCRTEPWSPLVGYPNGMDDTSPWEALGPAAFTDDPRASR